MSFDERQPPEADPDASATRPALTGEPSAWSTPDGPPVAWTTTPPPRPRRHRTAAWVLVTVALVALIGSAFVGGIAIERTGLVPGSSPQAPADLRAELPLLYQAWGIVDQHYVDQGAVDPTKQTYGAIKGLLESLGDTGHSDFLTPQQAAEMSSSLSGHYAGIGALVTVRKDGPAIVTVYPGSPAEKAGIKAGDRIVAVNGEDVSGLSSDVLSSKIRGPAGSTVRVSILRAGETAPREFLVTRAEIKIPNVTWTMVPGRPTAMIRIESFANGTTDSLKAAITAARKAGATSLLLDLRGNPGGYVNEAIGVASQFLSSGVVYLQRDASGKETSNAVQSGGIATDLPLAVLVDDSTASASEIVSGALQDAGRAKLVGVTTYGTGTVLSSYRLSDGSQVRLGVAEWLTPKGRQIWHHGNQPDVQVVLPTGVGALNPSTVAGLSTAALQASRDAQLLKALDLLGGNG
jgi:carboxyl-terminal processing protease